MYPKLNQSLKCRFDYIIVANKRFKGKKDMEDFRLDRFFEGLEFSFQHEFPSYIVEVSEVKGYFYVLVRKPRRKILEENLKNLLDKVKHIFEGIYNKFAEDSNSFRYNYFPYFKLVKCYGNYQYHVLVV